MESARLAQPAPPVLDLGVVKQMQAAEKTTLRKLDSIEATLSEVCDATDMDDLVEMLGLRTTNV